MGEMSTEADLASAGFQAEVDVLLRQHQGRRMKPEEVLKLGDIGVEATNGDALLRFAFDSRGRAEMFARDWLHISILDLTAWRVRMM